MKKLSWAVLILFFGVFAFLGVGGFPVSFVNSLVKAEPMPADSFRSEREPRTVIYVLGGGQRSLLSRFKTAAGLYHQGMASKVLTLSRHGITEYSPALGRNLTNDEWAAGKLKSFGVPETDIEFVKIREGFFGTLSEAEAIPDFVSSRGYTTLILVSSQYHTMRVWESFSKYSKDKNLKLFVYASGDHTGTFALLSEYFKLEFYRLFLIDGLSAAA